MAKWIKLTHAVGNAEARVNIEAIWYVKAVAEQNTLPGNPFPKDSTAKAVIRFGAGDTGTLSVIETLSDVMAKISAAETGEP